MLIDIRMGKQDFGQEICNTCMLCTLGILHVVFSVIFCNMDIQGNVKKDVCMCK